MNEQLAALRDVAATFDAAGIGYRVFGGWAVDFHAGCVTRMHDDVDLAIPKADLVRAVELLERAGWVDLHDADSTQGIALARDGVRLELTHMWDDIAWMGEDIRELDSVRSRIAGLTQLIEMKAGTRADDPDDAPKDEVDVAVLRAL